MRPFEFASAETVDQAIAMMKDEAAFKAGGIDLLDRMKDGSSAPSRLVDLRPIAALRGIKNEGGTLVIGATATLAELGAHAGIPAALAEAAHSAANPQIRNVATCGGNLLQKPRCWYYRNPDFVCLKKGGATCFAQKGENRYHAIFGGGPSYIVHPSTLATALSALGASVRLQAAGGKTRDVALSDFFVLPANDYEKENVLAPGEVLTQIRVPASDARTAFISIKEREVYDWPLAEVAVALTLRGGTCERASIVLGAAAPVPWHAKAAAAALAGKSITDSAAHAAGKAAVQGAQPLAHNGYKVALFEATVARAVLAAAQGRP